ncbi:MAG: non-heme iron oxygenase ferredoxin subunit [Acidimicrobiales bacterium]|jgi:3-phenylpropionate/trans-cinnamate dioxygenase ferredoxin subunit|nr:Rieske (2Fe-2S) protein [Acidimicrobiaceae bacterium]MDG2351664.1 non-heme iron oxygenase ferredoxin subunit [Acidimicrobiales bacterium]MDP6162518.1 non-heme iron oxygenase ferredoxin subunit [Acidimicrobiales bacterium]MDP6286048.1 non-heme iron oxygenase ferredoxin subunit [Acidimicrobiales bacterium]HJL91325.1 non-heme iron oxygenase ferredoxin subunit [Acidimicrobiales bacterium]|tara:strand:+ start:3218 stop:3532 length:315 start_codon:yes stop_codon:yes gene_type:complete
MKELKICDLTDLEEAVPRCIEVEGKKLSMVLLNEKIYALDDTCSHEDVSLSEGEVDIDECALECWKHGSLFSLKTGEALSLPATKSVKTYEVHIIDNDVVLVTE